MKFNVLSHQSLKNDGYEYHEKFGDTRWTLPGSAGFTVKLKERNGLNYWQGKIPTTRSGHRVRLNHRSDQHDFSDTTAYCNAIIDNHDELNETTKDAQLNKLARMLTDTTSQKQREPIRKALASLGSYVFENPRTDRLLDLHIRLGHPGSQRLAEYLHSTLTSAEIKTRYGAIAQLYCQACHQVKVKRAARNKGEPVKRATSFGMKISADPIGPFPKGIHTGYQYALVIQDDYSNHATIRGLHTLKDVPTVMDEHLHWLERVSEHAIATEATIGHGLYNVLGPKGVRHLQSDAGSVMIGSKMMAVLNKHKVSASNSAPYSQHQNRVEGLIRSLSSRANAMLLAAPGINDKGIDGTFWYYALLRSANTHNTLPTKANAEYRSPIHAITGKVQPDEHNHAFGSPLAVKRGDQVLKSDPAKGRMGLWLGWNQKSHAHQIHIPATHGKTASFVESRNVSFGPTSIPNLAAATAGIPMNADPDEDNSGTEVRAGFINMPAAKEQTVTEYFEDPTDSHDRRLHRPAGILQPTIDPTELFINCIQHVTSTHDYKFESIPYNLTQRATLENTCIDDDEFDQNGLYGAVDSTFDAEDMITSSANIDYHDKCYATIGKQYFSLRQAVQSDNGHLFEASHNAEHESLYARGVIEDIRVDAPEVIGKPIVKSMEMHHMKETETGSVKAKSRVVAVDKHSENTPNETAAYTPANSTIKMVTANAAACGRRLKTADVPCAYGQANDTVPIYVQRPPGQKKFDTDGTELIWKTFNLYGRKTAGRVWQDRLDKWLKSIGFVRASEVDPCLYKRPAQPVHNRPKTSIKPNAKKIKHTTQSMDTEIILAIHVDDALIDVEGHTATWFQSQLKQEFETQPGDNIKWQEAQIFLGYTIDHRTDKSGALQGIHLSQPSLVNKLLADFNMQEAHKVGTPLEAGMIISKEDCEKVEIKSNYRSGAATILYLACGSRPDLSYTASQLGRVTASPGKRHHGALKHAIRYLKGTKTKGIYYRTRTTAEHPGDKDELQGYADASWGSADMDTEIVRLKHTELPHDDAKSSGGYMVMFLGAAIEWKSKVQQQVSLSTAESELYAAADCCKALTHHRALYKFITGIEIIAPSTIFEDNTAVLAQMSIGNHSIPSRVRHIGCQFHYLRNAVKDGIVKLDYVNTKQQLADLLTKSLPKPHHQELTNQVIRD